MKTNKKPPPYTAQNAYDWVDMYTKLIAEREAANEELRRMMSHIIPICEKLRVLELDAVEAELDGDHSFGILEEIDRLLLGYTDIIYNN